VAVNYLHSQQAAMDLVAELSGEGFEVMACQADVASREQVTAMVREVQDRFGCIEVLINMPVSPSRSSLPT
jgi:3-oxoacyl-[acyl-carrier protein] reductase